MDEPKSRHKFVVIATLGTSVLFVRTSQESRLGFIAGRKGHGSFQARAAHRINLFAGWKPERDRLSILATSKVGEEVCSILTIGMTETEREITNAHQPPFLAVREFLELKELEHRRPDLDPSVEQVIRLLAAR
jgi:hypothetical protein